ncbi:hypothetical protein [Cellulomonas fengjieae]|uniref:hypothetical protein n=1 Tax=Cellulomonas fengjieae TaxID=2819978 RepID=UPI001AAE2845|nr:hypothetical protein [Cellulomonas fengjieae]MBO3103969.1 hypothetical protein [Cellulomonas fengjieae]
MQLALPFAEAMAIAVAREPLPPMVQALRCEGSTIHAEIDLRAIPDPSTGVRLAAAAAGTVAVTVRFADYSAGMVTLVVTAHARALPAHKLVPYLVGPINTALRDRGLPPGLVEVQRGESEPWVVIAVQRAISTKVDGVTLTGLALRDAVIHVEATVGSLRVH